VAALAVLAGVVGVSLLDRATLDNGVKRVQDVATATLDGAAARLNTLGWFTSKSPLSAAAIPAADAAAAPLGPPPSVEAAAATEPAPSPGHLAFAADSYSVSPDEVMAKVVVRRTDGVSGPVSFAWWIEAGSAVAGSDYAALGKHTEQLVDGQDRMTLYVPLVSDPAQKLTKMFYIVIGNAGGGATLGRLTRAAVFIIPDRFKSS
jgi:hypothetical protein